MSTVVPITIDYRKISRRGPEPLPVEELRTHVVSVRLNAAELIGLDHQRAPAQMQRGEYLRCAALHRLPPTIPPLNREAWVSLARAAGNLNAITRRLHEAAHTLDALAPPIDEISQVLADFRLTLVCAAGIEDEK